MENIPKVAIVTRTHNRNHLLRRAMESVLQQSMTDWHHWIVNDGGDAAALEKLFEEYADAYGGKCSLLHIEHAGMQAAAVAGIKASSSVYIAIHDDDDSWHPDFLRETTSYLDEQGTDSQYQGVIAKTERIFEEEQPMGTFKEVDRAPYVPLEIISLGRLGYENPFPPIAFLYRRSTLETVELYNPKWDLVADLDFNFRFLQVFEIGVIDKVLAYYHWRSGATSRDTLNTVTLQQPRHAKLLNELKNHYLRGADSTRDSTMALAFLISSYAVENQWMTSEIRDWSILSRKQMENLIERTQVLHLFNEETVWPKLEQLAELLQLANTANSQLEEIRKFNNDTAWPKLEQLAELLQLANTANSQLEEIRKFNNDTAWPKLEVNENANKAIQDRLEIASGHIENLASRNDPANILKSLSSAVRDLQISQREIVASQAQLAENLLTLKADVESLRKTSLAEWKLGPFQLRRHHPEGVEDSKPAAE